jgi:hypothetical protein
MHSLMIKWSEVCARFKENNVPHGKLKKVVELVLRLPCRNASIETCFPP